MTITTIVYDFGAVLVGWDPTGALADAYTPEQIADFRAGAFGAYNHRLDAGEEFEPVHAEFAAEHPEHAAMLAHYWANVPASLTGPIDGSEALVHELKEGGYRLLGLTNWSHLTFPHAPVAAPAIALMEDVLVSGEAKLAKPDPAIFTLLIERFDLIPEQTVFIDDSPANVEAARAQGLNAIRFTDVPALRADLTELGVAVGQ